jgi:pyruvate formate lyase activating enzyme
MVSVKGLMLEVERDMPFYERSGGGITVSGGEPLVQPVFLNAFLRTCKERGIHTALDTSGYAERDVLTNISKNVDLLLYDLKIMNNDKHKRYTGVGNKQILENLEALDTLGNTIIIRFPLIPQINSDNENIRAMCKLASRLRSVKGIDVLPYHKLGVEKARRLDKGAKVFETPSDEVLSQALKSIEGYGLEVKIGG